MCFGCFAGPPEFRCPFREIIKQFIQKMSQMIKSEKGGELFRLMRWILMLERAEKGRGTTDPKNSLLEWKIYKLNMKSMWRNFRRISQEIKFHLCSKKIRQSLMMCEKCVYGHKSDTEASHSLTLTSRRNQAITDLSRELNSHLDEILTTFGGRGF